MYKRQSLPDRETLHNRCDQLVEQVVAEAVETDRQAIYAAVSYTHLRAHETVLDLVCRLLLEKKKNITTDSATVRSSTQ